MLASMAFVLGVVVGLIVLATVGRAPGTAPELGGWALALGVLAAVGFVATGLVQGASFIAPMTGLASIALAAATILVGIGGLHRGARGWPTWVGLVLGGAPALLWIAFLVATCSDPEADVPPTTRERGDWRASSCDELDRGAVSQRGP